MLRNYKFWGGALFWSWNVIFLTFLVLGFAPLILIQLITAIVEGWVPWQFALFGSALVLIPILSVVVAVICLKRGNARLFALGYGVQGPLMVVIAARFFALRELTPPVALLLVAAVIGLGVLLWQLLDKNIDTRGPLPSGIRLAGLSLLLAIGLYISLWLAFYALPIAAVLLRMLGEALRELPFIFSRGYRATLDVLSFIPFLILGFILMLYSGTLVVLMPIAVPMIYAREWFQAVKAGVAKFGSVLTAATALACMGGLAMGYVLLNRQPQQQAFALLQQPPTNPQEAARLAQQEPLIRAGLLNAYLASYRYASAVGEVDHVADMYINLLSVRRDTAKDVQAAYEFVVGPLLYQPARAKDQYDLNVNRWQGIATTQDANKAAELYQQYFDAPINKAERDTIVPSVRTTWDVNRATAAWQAVDEREILLLTQTLTLEEQTGFANVELYEVYQNQTEFQQEVVYYFNMPESAVLTGVWLGDTADRSRRFVYRVSPRGAAQQLYREQVMVRRDPALLEQIGPRQYRLRIFPIEPKRWRWAGESGRSAVEDARYMHMWLTWRVLPEQGAWLMPQLAEKRNVYWMPNSRRSANGKDMAFDEERWLPDSLPITNAINKANSTSAPSGHRVDFANGQSVIAIPHSVYAAEFAPKRAVQKVGVVIDRSYSMKKNAHAVADALKQLSDKNFAGVDVYLSAASVSGEKPSALPLADVRADRLTYFGGQDPGELLTQFNDLSKGKTYDAVLVLTDDGGYELNDAKREIATPSAPVWMVHLGGALPLGYDDKMLQAIQASGGGVAMSLDEAFARMVARLNPDVTADLSGEYAWFALPTAQADAFLSRPVNRHQPSDSFAAFAARRLILAEIQRNKGQLSQNETLDYLHGIAKEQSIVTPYSSMIVLVNDEQRRQLDALEKKGDRFEREKEAVGETNNGGQPLVTGVPEPHEWALIAIAAAMLGWYWRKRRQTARA